MILIKKIEINVNKILNVLLSFPPVKEFITLNLNGK